jgi:hypothetical protein
MHTFLLLLLLLNLNRGVSGLCGGSELLARNYFASDSEEQGNEKNFQLLRLLNAIGIIIGALVGKHSTHL